MNTTQRGRDFRARLVEAVQAYWRDTGYWPGVEDLMARLDSPSRSNVHYHVERLCAEGILTRDTNARSLRLTSTEPFQYVDGKPVPVPVGAATPGHTQPAEAHP